MIGSTAHIDLRHLDRYVEGDAFLRDEILEIFEEQSRILLDRLEPASDDPTWHATVHTLKGASRGIGAWQLGEMSEVAEQLVGGVTDKIAARAGIVAKMKSHIEDTIEEIRHLRDDNRQARYGMSPGNGCR